MKRNILIWLCSFVVFQSFCQEKEVKESVEQFFIAFHNKDTINLRKMAHENIVINSVSDKKNQSALQKSSYSAFLKQIASIPNTIVFLEKILDYKIQIDANLAHVWTPYEFYVNGKFSHKGVNSFILIKDGEEWKIVHLIDTRRKE